MRGRFAAKNTRNNDWSCFDLSTYPQTRKGERWLHMSCTCTIYKGMFVILRIHIEKQDRFQWLHDGRDDQSH